MGTLQRCAARLGMVCLGLGAIHAQAIDAQPGTRMNHPVELIETVLHLRLDEARRQALGHARITLRPRGPLARVDLDAVGLHIDSVADAQGRALAHHLDPAAGDGDAALQITLPGTASAGDTLVLDIRYRTGHINPHDPRNPWGSTGAGLRWLAPSVADPRRRRQVWTSVDFATQRHWMPTLNGPGHTQRLDITITVPRPLVAVASGTPAPVQAHGDGTRSCRVSQATP
jgi:aminopeptidase N